MRTFPQPVRAALYAALRTAFRLLPLHESIRDRWRSAFLRRYADWAPPPPRGRLGWGGVRHPRVSSDQPAIGYVPYQQQTLPTVPPATLVAFYLPQFHPFAENEQWWGKGFTEWRNVTRALPQFEGHAQPRLPADLGFYDLRHVSVMREQARLAAEYGVGAFCFYFYWFAGKTLMEQPLRQWLDDAHITLPFCLCWANENWSRRWDGRDDDVLIAQQHSAEDDLAFIAHIAPYLRDRRYLRVDGKPMLLVYRPHLMPDPAATAARWRQWCHAHDVGEIHLAYVQGFERTDPTEIGFDAAVEFPPNLSGAASISARQTLINPHYCGSVLDWRTLANAAAVRPLPPYRLYPGVNPGWDNEPRRSGRGQVLLHASPRGYGDWLRRTIHERLADVAPPHRIVFINAWNEWAEGAVLEPDQRLGHAWLEQTRNALLRPSPNPTPRIAVVVHVWYIEALAAIAAALARWPQPPRIIVTTDAAHADASASVMASHGLASELRVHPNRGRDVLPFLHEADRLCNEGVDLVLKLHTKRSLHRHDGERWTAELLASLSPPDDGPETCIRKFLEQPDLGLLAPRGHLLPLETYLGSNADELDFLAARLGIATRGEDLRFPAGTMFWARLQALRPVLDAHLSPDDFQPEQAQTDGTLAHALERAFGAVVRHAGYRLAEADTGGRSASASAYPYAQPSR
ncbi:glycoside hydrolase family 99-like domain-containing protein [Xanthomonas albilineans]|uniref:glycoside hydrolase family 99-like domain-containing protein n=1 Tax=Xanthomonas albilineans TaxID=29447 RepID=UPI0005F3141E|nr:glycoside hydrolase family 99-like domain-containing protein [Xanthomonas albilineans]